MSGAGKSFRVHRRQIARCCRFVTQRDETLRRRTFIFCRLRPRCYELSARCRFVLELRKFGSRMRPWIAMVAAYALALQVLLSGIAGAHAMSAGSLAGELFVICHGSGDTPSDSQNLPDTPRPATPCVLCTLTSAPCAILPIDHSIATIDVVAASIVGPRQEGRIIEFDSPTGRYQRGPPARASISG
jgi:hypothetical protein